MQVTINESINSNEWILMPLLGPGLPMFAHPSLDESKVKDIFQSHVEELPEFFPVRCESENLLVLKSDQINTPGKLFRFFRKFFVVQGNWIKGHVHVHFNIGDFDSDKDWLDALINAYSWSGYQINREPKATQNTLNIIVDEKFEDSVKRIVGKSTLIGRVQRQIAHLVNLPSNLKYPEAFIDLAIKTLPSKNIEVKKWIGRELVEEGFYAIESVGKASAFDPGFLLLDYKPENYQKVVGLVGKGVTFDTGGISIKPSSNMHYMKCDMAGAAMMLGVMCTVSELSLPVRVLLAIPLAENSLNGNALKPGDLISSYSGKKIEIIDTDAEGRLILADAISFLTKNYPLDYLLDSATLTGSAVTTFGYSCAAMFSRDELWVSSMKEIGMRWDEKVWPLPLWDDYKEDLHSDVADIRNFSGKPIAGAITAALFLQSFVENATPWMHLDIAGVSFTESELGKMRNATAYGVRLVTEWLIALCSD